MKKKYYLLSILTIGMLSGLGLNAQPKPEDILYQDIATLDAFIRAAKEKGIKTFDDYVSIHQELEKRQNELEKMKDDKNFQGQKFDEYEEKIKELISVLNPQTSVKEIEEEPLEEEPLEEQEPDAENILEQNYTLVSDVFNGKTREMNDDDMLEFLTKQQKILNSMEKDPAFTNNEKFSLYKKTLEDLEARYVTNKMKTLFLRRAPLMQLFNHVIPWINFLTKNISEQVIKETKLEEKLLRLIATKINDIYYRLDQYRDIYYRLDQYRLDQKIIDKDLTDNLSFIIDFMKNPKGDEGFDFIKDLFVNTADFLSKNRERIVQGTPIPAEEIANAKKILKEIFEKALATIRSTSTKPTTEIEQETVQESEIQKENPLDPSIKSLERNLEDLNMSIQQSRGRYLNVEYRNNLLNMMENVVRTYDQIQADIAQADEMTQIKINDLKKKIDQTEKDFINLWLELNINYHPVTLGQLLNDIELLDHAYRTLGEKVFEEQIQLNENFRKTLVINIFKVEQKITKELNAIKTLGNFGYMVAAMGARDPEQLDSYLGFMEIPHESLTIGAQETLKSLATFIKKRIQQLTANIPTNFNETITKVKNAIEKTTNRLVELKIVAGGQKQSVYEPLWRLNHYVGQWEQNLDLLKQGFTSSSGIKTMNTDYRFIKDDILKALIDIPTSHENESEAYLDQQIQSGAETKYVECANNIIKVLDKFVLALNPFINILENNLYLLVGLGALLNEKKQEIIARLDNLILEADSVMAEIAKIQSVGSSSEKVLKNLSETATIFKQSLEKTKERFAKIAVI